MFEALKSGVTDSIAARLVLLANHVLSSEPAAMERLKPHAGAEVALVLAHTATWPLAKTVASFLPEKTRLVITPAGLLELLPAAPGPEADMTAPGGLKITVQVPDPLNAVKLAVTRQRPEVAIEGDAAFAEAMAWLMKNLRWDLEDDLARWLGQTPSQMLKVIATQVSAALARWRPSAGGRTGFPGGSQR
jgi:ubiquinone biosynthesis accessory factor UbiJ